MKNKQGRKNIHKYLHIKICINMKIVGNNIRLDIIKHGNKIESQIIVIKYIIVK